MTHPQSLIDSAEIGDGQEPACSYPPAVARAPLNPTVLDLFAGAAGGWSLGLHRAGFRTIAACEIDPWRRAVFSRNFPDAVMFDDARSLTAARVVAECGRLPDIIVGSPPCQDISTANTKGRGVDGARSGLFFEAIRLVGEIRPAWVALENSPNLRNRGYDRVAEGLEALGYTVWPFVVGADDVGANHRRKRVWIVAANAERVGVRRQPRRRGGADGAGEAIVGFDAADAARLPEGRIARQERQQRAKAGLDPYPAVRNIGLAWPDWNGGIASLAASCAAAGAGGIHDGLPSGLAPNARNRCIAAYGDAVLPQITELLGRAILAAEAARAAA